MWVDVLLREHTKRACSAKYSNVLYRQYPLLGAANASAFLQYETASVNLHIYIVKPLNLLSSDRL